MLSTIGETLNNSNNLMSLDIFSHTIISGYRCCVIIWWLSITIYPLVIYPIIYYTSFFLRLNINLENKIETEKIRQTKFWNCMCMHMYVTAWVHACVRGCVHVCVCVWVFEGTCAFLCVGMDIFKASLTKVYGFLRFKMCSSGVDRTNQYRKQFAHILLEEITFLTSIYLCLLQLHITNPKHTLVAVVPI